MGNGGAHIWRTQLRQHRAVEIFDHGVDDALRMYHHLHLGGRQAKQQAGLCQLQTLVHQGGRIDGNFAAHHPIGMGAGLLGSNGGQIPRKITKRATRGCQQQAAHARRCAPDFAALRQALEDGVVLAVDGDQRGAASAHRIEQQVTGHHQGFFVGQQ